MVKLTQTIGKEGELRVIGELLRRGFDVYLPAVKVLKKSKKKQNLVGKD